MSEADSACEREHLVERDVDLVAGLLQRTAVRRERLGDPRLGVVEEVEITAMPKGVRLEV